MNANEIISKIMELDDQIAKLRDSFEELAEKEKKEALTTLLDNIYSQIRDDEPLPFSLVRATDMVCGLETEAPSILAKGLAHKNEDVRHVTGEALLSVIDGDFELIEPAVDAVMAMGGQAAKEMPFLLTMADDPDVSKYIVKFLKHKESNVILAAVEALAEVGDPSCIPALQEIIGDKRVVNLEGVDEGESEEWALGKLAEEAIEMIGMNEEE